jgi:hypothetical protein
MSFEPYKTPEDLESPQDASPEVAVTTPEKVFSPNQIAAASFLGSPVAGGALMAINHRLEGDRTRSTNTLLYCVIGTLVLMLVQMSLPEEVPPIIWPLLNAAIMKLVADRTTGEAYARHLENGAVTQSNWLVAGLGLGIGLVFGTLLLLILSAGMQVMG